ncbi:DUF885 domain-containing protein [Saccharopolyspora sp. MS10]|uniref:DUF885 domain-containing protein n=1 Tax=Saccharopolyspora sp. MS10 TaxID=3385973 RepID=UPI0039A30259
MDDPEPVRGYLRLASRLGALDGGLVLSHPAGAPFRDEAPADPARLAELAARSRVELAGARLNPVRRDFLDGQLRALRQHGLRLAGIPTPFVAEAEECFGVRPERGDPERYRRAHAALDGLLPGRGDLALRLVLLGEREPVPPELLGRAVRALADALRARVRASPGLPVQERVDLRLVRGRPWSALHRYRGGFRSLVAVDSDRDPWAGRLPALVAHETYPGHHAEHCRKELSLVDRRGWAEHGVALRDTPQALLAEGIADLGLRIAVGPGWGRWAEDVLAEVGVALDGERAERVREALFALRRVRSDAALLLHRDGARPEEVVGYLRRWALLPAERARRFVRYIADPRRRCGVVAYVEGARLVRDRLDAVPGPETVRQLLDEPWTAERLRPESGPLRRSAEDPG